MTFYIRLKNFRASSQLVPNPQQSYYLTFLIDKSEMKTYKIPIEDLNGFIVENNEEFLRLTMHQHMIEIRFFSVSEQHQVTELGGVELFKQKIMKEKEINTRKNLEVVKFQVQLENRNQQNYEKMARVQVRHRITLEIKHDKYKKLMGRTQPDTGFLSQLGKLHSQLHLQRHSTIVDIQSPEQPKPSRQNQQPSPLPRPQPSRQHQAMQRFYIGPCQTKNLFSYFDEPVNKQHVKIIEPQY